MRVMRRMCQNINATIIIFIGIGANKSSNKRASACEHSLACGAEGIIKSLGSENIRVRNNRRKSVIKFGVADRQASSSHCHTHQAASANIPIYELLNASTLTSSHRLLCSVTGRHQQREDRQIATGSVVGLARAPAASASRTIT